MAQKASKPSAKRHKRGVDSGPPITIGDNSLLHGGRAGTGCVAIHTAGFTKVPNTDPIEYHVCAMTDEQCTVGEVHVPGMNPAEITPPWNILLGNGIIVRSFGDDVVQLVFPSAPTEGGPLAGGKPTRLEFDGDWRSAAVMSSSIAKLVSFWPGEGIEIDLDTQTGRAKLFSVKK